MAKRRRNGVGVAGGGKADRFWTALTWDDLDAWAGSRSVTRGRTYQRGGRVKNLAMSEDGRLLADVLGGQRYVVGVWRAEASSRESPLESRCTCPVGFDGCKHAVAVVAEFLERLAGGETVVEADPDDPRWARLEGEAADAIDEDEPDPDDDEWDEDDEESGEPVPARRAKSTRRPRTSSRRSRAEWDRRIEEHIRAKSREELADLVVSLTERFPELREEFKERLSLAEGDVERLVAQARREMREQTSQIGWRNSWTEEGNVPDYSRFRHRLERMVELGHADAVVELGREFIKRGLAQVGESHDEGETGMEVAECLPVIFAAVSQSSLAGPEQLLFAIDACLEDDYGVIDDATDPILEGDWGAADWAEVAERLRKRLKSAPAGDDDASGFSRKYRREGISDWLAQALRHAGREGELRGVYEAEARATGSYDRLVRYLREAGQIEDACRWALEGIERTAQQWPGIAASLAVVLREVAESRRQWDVVAAHVACDFFQRPGTRAFDELLKAARKAKCEGPVRAAALGFLETGKLPIRLGTSGKGRSRTTTVAADENWPLPCPEYLRYLLRLDGPRSPQPHFDVLLDMAIAEKRSEDVLHWFGKMGGERRARGYWGAYSASSQADRVAAAIAETHPERALEIYTSGLNRKLEHANPNAYDSAAKYLKLMRPILRSLGRGKEWNETVARLREEYKRRPLFVEALDRLEGRTIVQAQGSRRR